MKKRFSRIATAIATAKPFLLLTVAVLLFACTFVSCGKKAQYVTLTVQYVDSEGTEQTGDIVIQLRPDVAPITVENFESLVSSGFYDGLTFHRVYSGFMIQGGDPDGNGTGGPGYEIKGEFSANGFKNDLKHTLGVLSMARTMIPDSAGSQFFIMVADAPHLDGQYAAFGKITENAQAAVDISRVNRNMYNDMPKKPQVIKTIRVDTQGVDYPEPEKM